MIEVFQKDDFNVRVHQVDGQCFFSMADVCKNLQIKNSRSAKGMVDDGDVISVQIVDADRGYKANFVSEKGLYKIVSKTKSPLAKPFQDWLYGEVLPAIRRNGAYAMPGTEAAEYQRLKEAEARHQFGILKFTLAQMMYNEGYTAEEMLAAVSGAALELAKGIALNYDTARWETTFPPETSKRLGENYLKFRQFRLPTRSEQIQAKGGFYA